jgi:sirohydrochlorin cobaltochelatase
MPSLNSSGRGLMLFAHGARDPRWAEPFVRVAERVRATAQGMPVELAYLEFLTPDMRQAAERLVAQGATTIRIVPLFFGRGGHLREAVPKLVAATAAAIPDVSLELAGAAGEDAIVVEAIAAFCLREAGAGGDGSESGAPASGGPAS